MNSMNKNEVSVYPWKVNVFFDKDKGKPAF